MRSKADGSYMWLGLTHVIKMKSQSENQNKKR